MTSAGSLPGDFLSEVISKRQSNGNIIPLYIFGSFGEFLFFLSQSQSPKHLVYSDYILQFLLVHVRLMTCLESEDSWNLIGIVWSAVNIGCFV